MKSFKSGETFEPTISFIVPLSIRKEEIVSRIEGLFNYASGYGGFVEIFLIDNGSKIKPRDSLCSSRSEQEKISKAKSKLI